MSVRSAVSRGLVAVLVGAGLTLGGSVAAQAGGTGGARSAAEAGAAAGGGNAGKVTTPPVPGMAADLFKAIVPNPYRPDPTAYFGPHKCNLYIKDYWPTPGCGGFSFSAKLSGVRDQPAFQQGVAEDGWFSATADVTRTYGCTGRDGVFDRATAFDVTSKGERLGAVYREADWSFLLSHYRSTPSGDFGPQFFANFKPVEVGCAPGATPTQHGLTVTDLKVSFDHASKILGDHRTWHFGTYEVSSGNS
ncbi:hypothetical protein ACH4FX_08575 [Streptomyces sp. NPDC018019]|uniref:hypothetical protein n=1 Tax=Streptomyces sp. NPDC018019 TaxID=3365030 RepID=UPI0037B404D2